MALDLAVPGTDGGIAHQEVGRPETPAQLHAVLSRLDAVVTTRLHGLVLGLVQEWSTMLVRPTYKEAIGFLVLILVLLVRPQGIFGQARTV